MKSHYQSRSQRWRRGLAVFAAAGLVVAACGGDDDSTDDTVTTVAEETAVEEAVEEVVEEVEEVVEEAAGGADVADSAVERVAAFRESLTALPFEEATDAPSGVNVFYVQCSVAVCAEIAVGVEAAAAELGWNYTTASHQDTPDTVASAFDAAIAAQPDVVLTSGNPREWFADQLAVLEEAGIPVVAWSLPEAYEPGDGISVNLLSQDDYYFYGVLMADYAAVESETKEILFVGLPTFPVLSIVQQGFEEEIAAVCPDCNVKVIEVAVTDIGTNLPGTIISELQTNSDLDMIVYAFGGMLFGVPDALDSAGLIDQAAAISQAGGPMNFGFIANGQHQVAEVGIASELLGWRALDAAARILNGEGPGRASTPSTAQISGRPDIVSGGLPLQILEVDTIDDPAALWPGVPGFEELFISLWGR